MKAIGAGIVLLAAAASSAGQSLEPIVVQGERARQTLLQQTHQYLSAVLVQPWEQSLVRWGDPICPLVAGLPRDQGEFILARLSQDFRDAGAELAPAKCRATLYVVLTGEPAALLEAWRKRDRTLFNEESVPAVHRFVTSTRPIRVWYNCMSLTGFLGTLNTQTIAGGWLPGDMDSQASSLSWDKTNLLESVLVVVDLRRVQGVNLSQVADYVALVGLTEVRQDAAVGDVPTILHLFAAAERSAPSALSEWDRALLRAVYHTDLTDKMQFSEIERHMRADLVR